MSIVVRIIPLILLYLAVVTDGAPCCMACSPCCCGCGGGGNQEEVSSEVNRADSGNCGYYSAQPMVNPMDPVRYEGSDDFMRGARAPPRGKGKPARKAPPKAAAKPKPKPKPKPAKAAAKPAKAAAKPAKAAAKPAKGAAKPAKGAAKPAKGAARPAKAAAKPAKGAAAVPGTHVKDGVGPIRYANTKEEDAMRQVDPPPGDETNLKVAPKDPVYWND